MQPWLTMARNNAWANETLYTPLTAMTPEAFAAPRPGFFPSLMETMNHIHLVDLYYIDALIEGGLGRSLRHRVPERDPIKLASEQLASDLRLISFCKGLTAGDIGRRVRTERPDDPHMSEEIGALLPHLFQHQIHHRGQAHVQLQEAGIAPPQLDDFHLDHGRVHSAMAWFDGSRDP